MQSDDDVNGLWRWMAMMVVGGDDVWRMMYEVMLVVHVVAMMIVIMVILF